MPVDRTEMMRIARTWIGVPFRHQGRNRQGVDCGGLLIAVGIEAGMTIIQPATYSLSPDSDVIRRALAANCRAVTLDMAQPGDVLYLSFAGEPRHVAIMSDVGMIHAWAKPGKVVEHRIDGAWHRRIVAAYSPYEVAP